MNATVGHIEELLLAQQFAEAHRCAVDALVASPGDYRASLALARADLHLGSLQRALWAADRACWLAPNESAVHFVRAEILGAMGEHREQLRSVRAGLALTPGSSHGQQMLAMATSRTAARRSSHLWWATMALLTLATGLSAVSVAGSLGAAWSALVVTAGLGAFAATYRLYRRHSPMAASRSLSMELALSAAMASTPTLDSVSPSGAAKVQPVRQVVPKRMVEPMRPMVGVGH
ncbi:MAG: hypothetical protein ABMA25_05290 [Ilumatobacteraceae bacterium]